MDRPTFALRFAGAAWVVGAMAWGIQPVSQAVMDYVGFGISPDLVPLLLTSLTGAILLVPAYLVGIRGSRGTALVGGLLLLAVAPVGWFVWTLTCGGPDAPSACVHPTGLLPIVALVGGVINLAAGFSPTQRSPSPPDNKTLGAPTTGPT